MSFLKSIAAVQTVPVHTSPDGRIKATCRPDVAEVVILDKDGKNPKTVTMPVSDWLALFALLSRGYAGRPGRRPMSDEEKAAAKKARESKK